MEVAPTPQYTLLYGALKNMGDYLIYERSKQLLRVHKRMEGYLEFNGVREPLDEHVDEINKTRAVVICGGPGLVWNMYPRKYPLTRDLDAIKVPIIVLGSGWFGVPGDGASLAEYDFNASTHLLFDRIKREGHDISVRDRLSEEALRRNGVDHVSMTGCPSWYDLEHLDHEFEPGRVSTVAFTPPASQVFAAQAVRVMERLRRQLPDATLICSFHRGIEADDQTPERESAWARRLAAQAEALGYQVKDGSYGLENVAYYDDCDLHVGYRVHGHLYFLARRRPSILIHEDGRGRGASEAIGLPGIQGGRRSLAGRLASVLRQPKLTAFLGARRALVAADPKAPEMVEAMLVSELASGFASFKELPSAFRHHYQTMVRFLDRMP